MKILISTIIFLLSSNALAYNPLPLRERKLWNYIKENQVKQHRVKRYIGGWPTYSRIKGIPKKMRETNSFLPAQLLVILDELEEHYSFKGIEEINKRANDNFDTYLADAKLTNEPAGTLSYWPIQVTKSGELKRTFSVRFPYRKVKILNLPNDFDSSSQAFMWFHLNGIHSDYLDDFVHSVADFPDSGRSVVYKNDKKWKPNHSGAIVTWVERDRVDNSKSRIYNGINDVDCVVNLNVLTALSTYQNEISSLPPKTEVLYDNICSLMNTAVLSGTTKSCGVWYDRSSQFYTAYAKAISRGTSCLDDSLTLAKQDVEDHAKKLLIKKGRGGLTEVAEYISVMKRLWPVGQRPSKISDIIFDLSMLIRLGLVEKGNQAYLRGEDSLFTGRVYGMKFNWYSRSFSTALALEALLLR